VGTLTAESAAAFGADAEHFASVDALAAHLAAPPDRTHDPRQGLARDAHGAQSSRRSPAMRTQGRTDAAVADRAPREQGPRVQRFGYLTLRAVLACMTALLISFIVGPR
jgi:hypothetical protein